MNWNNRYAKEGELATQAEGVRYPKLLNRLRAIGAHIMTSGDEDDQKTFRDDLRYIRDCDEGLERTKNYLAEERRKRPNDPEPVWTQKDVDMERGHLHDAIHQAFYGTGHSVARDASECDLCEEDQNK